MTTSSFNLVSAESKSPSFQSRMARQDGQSVARGLPVTILPDQSSSVSRCEFLPLDYFLDSNLEGK